MPEMELEPTTCKANVFQLCHGHFFIVSRILLFSSFSSLERSPFSGWGLGFLHMGVPRFLQGTQDLHVGSRAPGLLHLVTQT